MCVTCRKQDSITLIRVQSNSFPDHCFKSATPLIENLIDFEVAFTPDISGISPSTFGTQSLYDDHFCRYDWPKSPPTLFTLKKGEVKSIVGLTLAGVPIFSGTSEFGSDAFFSNNLQKPYFDSCLGSAFPSQFYHYYSFSPCILNTQMKSLLASTHQFG